MLSPLNEFAVITKNLEKRFGDFIAVNRINLAIKKGEIFGFLGPNGAGKSTVIRMLCGILRPSGGEGKVAGLDLLTQTETIKLYIGYMSQKFSLYDDLTVEENINFYAGIYRLSPEKIAERKEWTIRMAGLEKHRQQITSTLAGGWKQRLSLGCAILHEPPIVFLDEPTSGVDPLSRRDFWNLIQELANAGTTIFVTTHYMDEAEYCDRLAFIYRGELVAVGTPEELKTRLMLDQVIEIVTPKPTDAMEVIRSMEDVKEVALFGDALHVVIPENIREEKLREALISHGLSLERFERIVPSLEDVFVSLIEAKDRE